MPPPVFHLPVTHRRRLREVWRSAGWPYQDLIEVELLAAGLLERRQDASGRETLRVTDAGLQVLAQTLQRNRAALDAHEQLVGRVALDMQRAGRVVWRGLALRAALPGAGKGPQARGGEAAAALADLMGDLSVDLEADLGVSLGAGLGADRDDPSPADGAPPPAARWAMAVPDVFSIRHTTREDLVEPIVHEIKVRRADLLADLRHPDKRAAYLALSSQCWYVLKAGIAEPEEVPQECGVMVAHLEVPAVRGAAGPALEVLRPAPRRPHRMAFATWMALARASAEPPSDDSPQDLF
ncbi:MAG: hypothetical protein WCT47_20095 [Betaproteobacteria bacterium]|jgi:hypothetical protein